MAENVNANQMAFDVNGNVNKMSIRMNNFRKCFKFRGGSLAVLPKTLLQKSEH